MDILLNPLLYVAFAFAIWQCFRLRAQHRLFWGVSLFSPGRLAMRRIAAAVAVGAVLSAVSVLSGSDFGLSASHGWWLWSAAVLLGLIRVRFMGFSYVAGTVSVLVLVSRWLNPANFDSVIQSLLLSLQAIDVGNLLFLAGVLTVLGGLLTVWKGSQSHCPVLLSRRGKSLGAFVLQPLWAVPVIVQTGNGWLILPALLVYTDLAIARNAEQRARLTGLWTTAFGVTLAVIGATPFDTAVLLWVGAIWALFGQEVISRLSYRHEHNGTPKFRMRDDGICVLAVKDGSPAADMGIRPGEVITHANGQAVRNMTDLYAALQQSPAFCKLEVVNEDNEQRYTQRSLYADEPHQLGIVPVVGPPFVEGRLPHRFGWWSLLMGRTSYRGNVTEHRLEG